MISTFDNCLFIHIPKTAGQSIESVFLNRAGLSWQQRDAMLLRKNSNPNLGPPRLAHLTAQEYLAYSYLSEQQFHAMFKFTIVRNPWDRLVSEYRYKQHRFSFKDFIFKHFPKKGQDDYQGFNGIYRHVMPQYQFIYDDSEKLMVDYVGRFENLAEDFYAITKTICNERLTLPIKNQTNNISIKTKLAKLFTTSQQNASKASAPRYQDYYDRETAEAVKKLYQKDITFFNYTF